jgi:hypothetical protein
MSFFLALQKDEGLLIMAYTLLGFSVAFLISFLVSRLGSFRSQTSAIKFFFVFFTFLSTLAFICFSFLEALEIISDLGYFMILGLLGIIGSLCITNICFGFYLIHLYTQDLNESIPDSLILLFGAIFEGATFYLQKNCKTGIIFNFFDFKAVMPFDGLAIGGAWFLIGITLPFFKNILTEAVSITEEGGRMSSS